MQFKGQWRDFALAFRSIAYHNCQMATPKRKIEFEAVEMMIGRGWYVLVKLPSGPQPQLGGFNSEAEARDWITRKSAVWLKEYQNGKYA